MGKVKQGIEGKVVMYKRFLRTATVAFALGAAIPVPAAFAMHAIDSGGAAVSASSGGQSLGLHKSGFTFGSSPSLNRYVAPSASQGASQARLHKSGFAFGSSPSLNRYVTPSAGQTASQSKAATPSSDNGFNWGNAGIGAGILLASLLVVTAGALALRRQRPLAH